MLKRRKEKQYLDVSEIQIPLSEFLESYNGNIPVGFPRASTATLKEFQGTHATLFKHGNMWSVAQHRKRVIDWLPSHLGVL